MSAPGTILPVLMALRVKGRAAVASVAVAAGLSADAAQAALDLAGTRGLGERVGAHGVFALTPAGRAELAALLAAEGIDRAVLGARYDEFLTADAELKRRVSAWQLERAEHSSARAGAALAAVRAAGADARAVAGRLAAVAPRLAPYAQRLAGAERRLAAGDERFVASPQVDSLHQVWFELHEDLLVTLGRERQA